jgi:hypothetical protein
MNYIKQLEADNKALKQTIADADKNVDNFLCFLHGPKFTGTENGERKDWISTGDVIAWLRELRNTLHQNGE